MSETIKRYVYLPENVYCIALAVVVMSTANGMQPTFSRRQTQLFINSDPYRVLTEVAEVRTDIRHEVF